MALIAVTDIDHGREGKDGAEHCYINAGEEVDTSLFTDEQLDELKRLGSVEESAAVEEVKNLKKQVEDLQAKLAAAESEAAGKNNLITGARNVDQTALDPQHGIEAGTILDQKTGKPVSESSTGTARPEGQTKSGSTPTTKTGSPAQNK